MTEIPPTTFRRRGSRQSSVEHPQNGGGGWSAAPRIPRTIGPAPLPVPVRASGLDELMDLAAYEKHLETAGPG